MDKYNIGDIFYYDEDYSNKVDFCNENNLIIQEIESDEKGRRFQIAEVNVNMDPMLKILELKAKLFKTDYLLNKYLEGYLSEEEYAPIKLERQAWRDEINQLERENLDV